MKPNDGEKTEVERKWDAEVDAACPPTPRKLFEEWRALRVVGTRKARIACAALEEAHGGLINKLQTLVQILSDDLDRAETEARMEAFIDVLEAFTGHGT